jgi:hypothetical protein
VLERAEEADEQSVAAAAKRNEKTDVGVLEKFIEEINKIRKIATNIRLNFILF